MCRNSMATESEAGVATTHVYEVYIRASPQAICVSTTAPGRSETGPYVALVTALMPPIVPKRTNVVNEGDAHQ